MARKFKDAMRLLHDLLDRHEAGTTLVRAYPDHSGFGDVTQADRFERELKRAAATRAVVLVFGTGRDRDRIARVELAEATTLYGFLDRAPAAAKAAEAAYEVFGGVDLTPAIERIGREAIESWSRNKQWSGLQPGDRVGLRHSLVLAQAIADQQHVGLDYRTFSRRVVGDSKALERLEQVVVRLLSGLHGGGTGEGARAVLSELGLNRFGPPLLLRGPLALDGFPLPATLPYFGIPARECAQVQLTAMPSYILSIENQTSFNRQVMETDPDREGIVLYTGGYPSLDIQRAINHFATTLPLVPLFHWSDIDPDGAWIFRTVERAAGRPVLPHLMSVELAESRGAPLRGRASLRSLDIEGSAIVELLSYFETPDARWLEQEELDPQMPV